MAIRIFPISALPATPGLTFPDCRQSASNTFWIEGLSVIGSPTADSELHYIWHIPPVLPTGTAKLELLTVCIAAGDAMVNPKWASVAVEETFDIALASLYAEGTQTLSYVSGDIDTIKRTKITLDADTVTADEFVFMRLVMEYASWTNTGRLLFLPAILWE